jgi:DNA-binding response OmpR family regulator
MAKVLLIEDDLLACGMIQAWLESESYTVDVAKNGRDGLELLLTYQYELIILDLALPDLDGIDILKQIRARSINTKVLVLTGRTTMADKEVGFESGADDYLTKPFEARELSMRLKALLRRPSTYQETVLAQGDLALEIGALRATLKGKDLALSPREFALLEFLMRNPNRVFSREDLINHIWKYDADVSEGAVRTAMVRLRKKLSSDGGKQCPIHTVYGGGYKFDLKPQ